MRILLASSEVYPYSKTGGLGDAVGALAKALVKAGHEVVVVTPLHRGVREKLPGLRRVEWKFDLPLGAKRENAELLALEVGKGLTVYFIDKPAYFDRAGIYSDGRGDFADNAERFIFFSNRSNAVHFSHPSELICRRAFYIRAVHVDQAEAYRHTAARNRDTNYTCLRLPSLPRVLQSDRKRRADNLPARLVVH